MPRTSTIVAFLVLPVIGVAVWALAGPVQPRSQQAGCAMALLDGDLPLPAASTASGGCGSRPCLYTTGFEADEDFVPGDIVD